MNCPPQTGGCGSTSSATSFASDNASGGGGVSVLKSQNVGPYETVQLHSTDPQALNKWLAQHNYDSAASVC